jgi:hypothetical protein
MKVKPRNQAKNEGEPPLKPTFQKSCPEISILDKAIYCVFRLISQKIGTFSQNTFWTSPLQPIDNQALKVLRFCPEPVQNCPDGRTKTVQNAKTLLIDLQHITRRFSKSVQFCPAFVQLKSAFLGSICTKRPLFEVWTIGQLTKPRVIASCERWWHWRLGEHER